MWVVDTSVGLKWFIKEDDTRLADLLLPAAGQLVAPDVIFTECAHAVKRRILDGFPRDILDDMCERLPKTPSRVFPTAPLAARAVRLSLELKLRDTNDCFFLALAEREKIPMVTADLKFIAAANRAGRGEFVVNLKDAASR